MVNLESNSARFSHVEACTLTRECGMTMIAEWTYLMMRMHCCIRHNGITKVCYAAELIKPSQ
jgi:hypothetical protein